MSEKKRITKVYTRVGDSGKTRLADGTWVKKNDPVIHAVGTIDELNSIIGIILAYNTQERPRQQLLKIQNDLFILGAEISLRGGNGSPTVTSDMVKTLENWIDEYNRELGPLEEFILPGGVLSASFAHLARTVTRRAERWVVAIKEIPRINPQILSYINRLSDYFFNLARWLNKISGFKENFIHFKQD